jgi:thiol-disulfide isomerase/thioredoxin
MKYPILTTATAVFLTGLWPAFAQTSDAFTIRGRVSTPLAGKVYLQAVNERGFPATIDSAAAKGGAFEFRGKTTQGGGFYLLNLANAQRIPLLLEGGETLTVDITGKTANVTGSKTAESFQKINQLQSAFQAKAADLNAQYEAATAKKDTKRQQQIKEEFDRGQQAIAQQVRAMMPDLGTSLTALYATNFLDAEQDFALFESLADRFAKEKPNARMTQAFVAQVRRMQAQKNGLAEGKPAPEIVLKDPNDKVVPLSSLKGKYVLIDFWASWCGPCRKENPNVVRMYQKYKDKGFEIYGVSLDQNKAAWLNAIKADSLTWTHVSDLKFWNNAAAVTYGVQAIPFSVLIDPQGNILAKNLRGETLEAKLAEVLK